MTNQIYQCGMCGSYIDSEFGEPLIKEPTKIQMENAIMSYCRACDEEEIKRQNNKVQVTKEMAMDAQCPEMEGMWIDW